MTLYMISVDVLHYVITPMLNVVDILPMVSHTYINTTSAFNRCHYRQPHGKIDEVIESETYTPLGVFIKPFYIYRTTYYRNGIIHRGGDLTRDGGPAIQDSLGKCMWMCNGKLHRDGGPALIEPRNPNLFVDDNTRKVKWYKHGKLHRLDGHAYEVGDDHRWYVDGVWYKDHFDYRSCVRWYKR